MDRKTILQRILDQTEQLYNTKPYNKSFNPIHSTLFRKAQILHLGKSNLKPSRNPVLDYSHNQSCKQHKSFTVSIQKHQGTRSQRVASYYRQQTEKQKSLRKPYVPILPSNLVSLNQVQFQKINDVNSDYQKQLIISKELDLSPKMKIQFTEVYQSDTKSTQHKSSAHQRNNSNDNPEINVNITRNKQYLIKHIPRSYHFITKKNTDLKIPKKLQEISQQNKKMKAIARKQLHKHYAKPFIQPPKITSVSYIIYQCASQYTRKAQLHYAFQSKNPFQIASLTKIMTCILTIETCKKLGIQIQEQSVTITSYQSNVPGTSANIEPGDIYTIQQLLYGLMLPSGNDASFALAIYIGKKILQSENLKCQSKQIRNQSNELSKRNCYFRFIGQMNKKANQLGMTKTRYANAHGLANQFNKSCCYDLAILCNYALKNNIFSQIVKSKNYKCKVSALKKYREGQEENQKQQLFDNDEQNYQNKQIIDNQQADIQVGERQEGQLDEKKQNEEHLDGEIKNKRYYQKSIFWENTHKLLHQKATQYIGIKTGVTRTAGPCLASCLVSPQGRKFIIIILNCKSMKWRFTETQILKKWVYRKQGIIIRKPKQSKILDQISIEEEIFQSQEPIFHSLQNIPI